MNAVVKETENQIVEFDEFELKLQDFKDKYDDVVYDLTVPEQEKQARSDKRSIGKVLSKLDSVHKALKAPLKEKVDLIDGRRKEIKDQLLEVQEKIKGQIISHDKAIEEHAEMLQGKVDNILLLGDASQYSDLAILDSKHWANCISSLKNINVDDSYEDRKADATLAKVETFEKLEIRLEARINYEEEQAELERLRKESVERERADREEKIRQEAKEKADFEAEDARIKAEEQAEKEKKEAAKKAQDEIDNANRKQQEAEEAEARAKTEAKDKAEKAAREEREKIEREQAEKERKEKLERDKEQAKKNKAKHRNKIEKEANVSLVEVVFELDDAHAEPIIEAIKEGKIKHISINY